MKFGPPNLSIFKLSKIQKFSFKLIKQEITDSFELTEYLKTNR